MGTLGERRKPIWANKRIFLTTRPVQEWNRLLCKVSSSRSWEVPAEAERLIRYFTRKLAMMDKNRSMATLEVTSQFMIQETSNQTQKVP